MGKNVIIIGAGGHGKVIADIVTASGDNFLGFLDDDESKKTLGKIADYEKYAGTFFVIGIGNPKIREKISKLPCRWYKAVHPSAVISPSAKIGQGTVVMPNAVINADAQIGSHAIINTSAAVEHDNEIGDFAHISVGAKLGGTVKIGKSTHIGIGASVRNNITVCEECIIGAGAVVVKNIEKPGIYKGIPAKLYNN
ncbi:MAG: acetyltransferase [Firmicutes bacterium]|nr:acetyltransferase [Bacillota bacterium]